jgi:hypothetical protein
MPNLHENATSFVSHLFELEILSASSLTPYLEGFNDA